MNVAHTPPKTYFVIYLALLVGLTATVAVAFVSLGPLNLFVAMAIAITKATLVVLYFMHVATGPRLNRVVIGSGLVWLAILLVVILSDYATRDWIPTRAPAQLVLPSGEGFHPPREAGSEIEEHVRMGECYYRNLRKRRHNYSCATSWTTNSRDERPGDWLWAAQCLPRAWSRAMFGGKFADRQPE